MFTTAIVKDKGVNFYFASSDGERFYEFTGIPTEKEFNELQTKQTKSRTKRLSMTRGFLARFENVRFTEHN